MMADQFIGKVLAEKYQIDSLLSEGDLGNFYHGKKKCVVMLDSFKKDGRTAFVVYAMSDRIFQPAIESFSKELHLKK